MKHLVIAEKPSVGRDIARVLHCNKKTNTYIEGTDYIVTWALGHLVTLADPEQYDEQYKTWNMDTLPMLPEHWKLVVIKQTIVIGNPLMLSPDFPPLHTGRESFPSSGVPSSVTSTF